jgi:uncharacterized protein YggE
VGQSVRPADLITISVPITGRAETAAAARAANGAAITALTEALVKHGIDRRAITMLPASARFGFVGNEASDPEMASPPRDMAAMMARKTASSTLRIRLADPAMVSRVQDALDDQNQAMMGAPFYSLRDERTAKAAAIEDALTKVRQDADAYAASLGLRVERITSVSNYGDATPTMADVDFFTRMMSGAQDDRANSVTTRTQIWVNFVLTPS